MKDFGFKLAGVEDVKAEVVHTFDSVVDTMKTAGVSSLAIQKLERIRELTKKSKATTFELMKNLHDIFDNAKLLKSMGYGKGEFGLMCYQLFGLPKEVSSKYATSGAYVIEENGMYMTPFAQTDDLGFVTDITPTALIEMTFPKKYNDKGITLEVFSNFWNGYIEKCAKMPTTKQIRDFKKTVIALLDENENALDGGFTGVVALLEAKTVEPTQQKTVEPTQQKTVEPTQQKAVEPTQQDEDSFDIKIIDFDIAEIAEMLKDKKEDLEKIDPTKLFHMFGADVMDIFSKAIEAMED